MPQRKTPAPGEDLRFKGERDREVKRFSTLRELAEENPQALEALKIANRRKLWLDGNLRHLTRPHGQRKLYDHAQAHPTVPLRRA